MTDRRTEGRVLHRPHPLVLVPQDPGRSAPARPGPAPRAPFWWLAAAVVALLGFVLVLTVVVATGGVDRLDAAVLARAVALRTPVLTLAARALTTLGSAPVVVTAAVLGALVLWRRTRALLSSIVLLVAVVVTGGGVYLTKIAVGRARPSATTLLGAPSWDYAFPSGHATNGAVVYVLGALLLGATLRPAARRAVLVAAVLLAAAVGLSRVYLGYHWGTDVLAGWCLAGAVVLTAGFVALFLTAGGGSEGSGTTLTADATRGAAVGPARPDQGRDGRALR